MQFSSKYIYFLFTLSILLSGCFLQKKQESVEINEPKQKLVECIDTINGGTLKGLILNTYTKEPLPFANVYVTDEKTCVKGSQTNFDGYFLIENIKAGTYMIKVEFLGYNDFEQENFQIKPNEDIEVETIFLKEEPYIIDEKPIIYLYPEKTQEIDVQLNYDGKLIHTYPKYNGGWQVTAFPDGTLYDQKGKEYYALYWEGINNRNYTVNEGTIVKGSETIEFLEESLETLGLNRKEANEFIIYWLPKLESNPYNLIHFATTEYEAMAELVVSPKPETLIRVMMVFKGLDEPIEIEKQNIEALSKKRKGFTVVEWGGTELTNFNFSGFLETIRD